MVVKRYKSLYLPALTIVATVVILLIVIAVSTYRNINRERGRMEEALLREGRVVMHVLEAALKEDIPAGTTAPPSMQRLNRLLEHISREPEISGISIINSEGKNVAYSSLREAGRRIGGGRSLNLLLREKGMVTRYGHDPAGERIFEIIQPLHPVFSSDPLAAAREKKDGLRLGNEPLMKWSQDKIIVLSFRLRVFETAKREDILHIILMGAILIILGTGALYFVFIVHNYYRIDRTLGQIKTYMENVVDSMTDGLISLDENGHVVTMNRQAMEILGAEAGGCKGKAIGKIFGDTNESFLREARDQIIRDREMEVLRRDGGRIPLSLSAAPLKDDKGRELGAVLIIRNLREIEELKEKVRRSERLAAVGRLAAGMAHEIRNPLSSIRGFAQFFLNRFREQKTEQEYASIMIREVDRLNRVITELLDFARPREPRREVCSLKDIINYTLKILSPELAGKKVRVEQNYEKELPPVAADQEQLSQAFLNLLLNALYAVEEDGEIIIGMRRFPDRSALDITIADNGRGIPPENLEKVFEPFFSTKPKGTGLGLAIAYRIVENHGGEITVNNRQGGGTIFSITLPLHDPGNHRG